LLSWLGTCDGGACEEGVVICGGQLRVTMVMDNKP